MLSDFELIAVREHSAILHVCGSNRWHVKRKLDFSRATSADSGAKDLFDW
jgi:hypothetical protein